MYKVQKTYITEDKKMIDLINENFSLLICLQHFNIDFAVGNKTVSDLCNENNLNLNAFTVIANLYNGFFPTEDDVNKIDDITLILSFLKKSHSFYTNDEYPEIKFHLEQFKKNQSTTDFQLIDNFFNEYFTEVLEHLKYEDEIAFPYFYSLLKKQKVQQNNLFSANEYKNHHTDIETKLTDLKNLFLRHLIVKGDLNVKRKFLKSLCELESDLKIHSIIEEKILIPLIQKIEGKLNE